MFLGFDSGRNYVADGVMHFDGDLDTAFSSYDSADQVRSRVLLRVVPKKVHRHEAQFHSAGGVAIRV